MDTTSSAVAPDPCINIDDTMPCVGAPGPETNMDTKRSADTPNPSTNLDTVSGDSNSDPGMNMDMDTAIGDRTQTLKRF